MIMKNFYLLLILCCVFSNCTDDDNDTTMTTTSTTQLASKPEAKAMFDNSYKGIYKGIVIGNVSGTLYVDIMNDDNLWAKFQTDNHETYILENIPYAKEDNQSVPNFKKFRFGNENVLFDIKMDDTGNSILASNLKFYSDANSKICIEKEKSTSLIKCYTGRIESGDGSGFINFVSNSRQKVRGLTKAPNSEEFTTIEGEISLVYADNEISKSIDHPKTQYQLDANLEVGNLRGLLDGYEFKGNWMYEDNELGTWNATRML